MSSSGSERENGGESRKKEKSRRPGNTAFRQQRLKAWQPILTPTTVLPLFFAVGIIFAPIGGLLLWASTQVQELVIDYTDCLTATDRLTEIPSSKVRTSFSTTLDAKDAPKWMIAANDSSPIENQKVCTVEFTLPNDLQAPVLLYYRLTNFYQNHRRYVKSLDEAQLQGTARTLNQLNKADDCSPLVRNDEGKPYYPCGLIANSLFNDTFTSPTLLNVPGGSTQKNETYVMTNKGISWTSDKERFGKTKYNPEDVAPPPNWHLQYPDGYTAENMPNLKEWEEFQVWMRVAGLPTFSKLARRNDNETMKAGTYQLDITYNFPVIEYAGTKSIVISTRTVMGGKNPFLGIAYVVVGGLCMILGALFTARHLIKPRKLGDHTLLSWNDEPPTATASGREVRGSDHA
ncbi:alkylphosphocholine resistance protein lem3 [Rhizina undulata]